MRWSIIGRYYWLTGPYKNRGRSTGHDIIGNINDGSETILTLFYNSLKYRVGLGINYQNRLAELLCYPGVVIQVGTNQIYNVIQSMDNCRVLTVGVIHKNHILLLAVTDSGKGISPEMLPRILERFFTTKNANERSRLGLDIVKKIVQKHSAKIEVASVIGQTTFNVSIPIAV